MQHQVKFASHFLAEGIIILLLFVPVLHYTTGWIPYWTYLTVLSGSCVLFFVFTRFLQAFFWYILAVPLLFLIFVIIGYPFALGAAFAVLLTWRALKIRQEPFLEQEAVYVIITSILAIALVLFFNKWEPALLLGLQFIIVVAGFMASHFVSLEQTDREQFFPKVGRLFGGLFLSATLALVGVYFIGVPVFMKIWQIAVVRGWDVFTKVMAFIATAPIYLFGLFDIKPPDRDEPFDPSASYTYGVERPEEQLENVLEDQNEPYIFWLLLIAAFGVLLFIAFKLWRRKFIKDTEIATDIHVEHTAAAIPKKKSMIKRMYEQFFQQPNHPARKAVYRFERQTEKVGQGRMSHETLHEWADRIDLQADTLVYEQVRYGQYDAAAKEIEQLIEALQAWKQGDSHGENQSGKRKFE